MVNFEKEKTALLILDVQNDIVHLKGKYADFGTPKHFKESGTSTRIKALLDKARETKLKVVYVKFGMRDFVEELKDNHTPILDAVSDLGACHLDKWGGEIIDELKPVKGEVVEKNRVNAFYNSKLEEILKEAWIDTLIITGVATNWVVEATARHASDADYQVIVVEDCCSSMTQELHDFAIKNILPNVGVIVQSEEIISSL